MIGEAYGEIMAYLSRTGLSPAGVFPRIVPHRRYGRRLAVTERMYETYLNSPEDTPEAELRTESCFPLKR